MKKNGFTPHQKVVSTASRKQHTYGGGFTLIEVLVAILIVSMGAFAVLALVSRTTTVSGVVNSRFVASYLAQEGIELVRNTRDSNFLELHKEGTGTWTDELVWCFSVAGCELDYNDTIALGYGLGRFLLLDSSGFYSYDTGTATPYKRRIKAVAQGVDQFFVTVEVTWEDQQGQNRSVLAETEFTNWLNPTPL